MITLSNTEETEEKRVYYTLKLDTWRRLVPICDDMISIFERKVAI